MYSWIRLTAVLMVLAAVGVACGDDSSDSSGNSGGGNCGNGTIEPPEQCDGVNLNQATCTSLGMGTGTLACNPGLCTFNVGGCMTGPMGGTTGG